jgi:hypothetical protein
VSYRPIYRCHTTIEHLMVSCPHWRSTDKRDFSMSGMGINESRIHSEGALQPRLVSTNENHRNERGDIRYRTGQAVQESRHPRAQPRALGAETGGKIDRSSRLTAPLPRRIRPGPRLDASSILLRLGLAREISRNAGAAHPDIRRNDDFR